MLYPIPAMTAASLSQDSFFMKFTSNAMFPPKKRTGFPGCFSNSKFPSTDRMNPYFPAGASRRSEKSRIEPDLTSF